MGKEKESDGEMKMTNRKPDKLRTYEQPVNPSFSGALAGIDRAINEDLRKDTTLENYLVERWEDRVVSTSKGRESYVRTVLFRHQDRMRDGLGDPAFLG